MTQFEQPFDQHPQQPQQNSTMAVVALVCSLIFFCPITTLLGPVLGLIALATIGSNPRVKGKGLAVAAILIGAVLTVGWGVGIYKGGQWFRGYVQFAMHGPQEALNVGFDGDIQRFKGHFHGRGASVSDQQAQQFIDTLRERYGEFQSSNVPQQQQQQVQQPAPGQTSMSMPYQLQFSQGSIEAEVELIMADPNSGQMMKKLGYILVKDPDRGNLRYPREEAVGPNGNSGG